jgi:hypothetical protein
VLSEIEGSRNKKKGPDHGISKIVKKFVQLADDDRRSGELLSQACGWLKQSRGSKGASSFVSWCTSLIDDAWMAPSRFSVMVLGMLTVCLIYTCCRLFNAPLQTSAISPRCVSECRSQVHAVAESSQNLQSRLEGPETCRSVFACWAGLQQPAPESPLASPGVLRGHSSTLVPRCMRRATMCKPDFAPARNLGLHHGIASCWGWLVARLSPATGLRRDDR